VIPVSACFVPPLVVWHRSETGVVVAIENNVVTPLSPVVTTVGVASSGSQVKSVHDCIPPVTHPMVDEPFWVTTLGMAARLIHGLLI